LLDLPARSTRDLAPRSPGEARSEECIGIDDGKAASYQRCMSDDAAEFCALFPAVYLRFCRRHERHEKRLTPQMDAVLRHLVMSGPLTIGEMARHFARAQSVVSEVVDGMEKKGLLERMRDERDKRRVLVWLTDDARALLARRSEVLDPDRVALAMRRLTSEDREALVRGMRALVRAADANGERTN
jgi:DNA-binding MarR family transcriptional regulator